MNIHFAILCLLFMLAASFSEVAAQYVFNLFNLAQLGTATNQTAGGLKEAVGKAAQSATT
jgi:hypothetical protein